jgi:ferrochelatase
MGRVGVLLLNLGGPEQLEDVRPFLFNLFSDPEIIRLPVPWLQKPLAWLISTGRAQRSQDNYSQIGGGSPLRRITEEQGIALQESLEQKGNPAQIYIGMRYWYPFTEEAIARIKRDQIEELVILPLYPQFSISTSGSSFRLLEKIWQEDPQLAHIRYTLIPSWYARPGYVKAMADLIAKELDQLPDPSKGHIFFSAHGVPVSYVEEAGDPYQREMEHCVELIMQALNRPNAHTLAYQSRVGPVEWLQPYTEDAIEELAAEQVEALVVVPISFVSEHIETLQEIDMEYREVADEAGIPTISAGACPQHPPHLH